MGTPGPLELILLFAVVLLIFGAKRIPEIARGIGKGIREFKDATSEISKELDVEDQNQQRRQINQPQSPQQGAPQARQQQSPEPASTESSGGQSSQSGQDASEQKAS